MESLDSVRANLATNVRMLRAAMRVSQEEIADQAGLERSQVSLIERELGNPSLKTLCQLSDAMGVPVPELLSAPGAGGGDVKTALTRNK